jgi:hypothetical protein
LQEALKLSLQQSEGFDFNDCSEYSEKKVDETTALFMQQPEGGHASCGTVTDQPTSPEATDLLTGQIQPEVESELDYEGNSPMSNVH